MFEGTVVGGGTGQPLAAGKLKLKVPLAFAVGAVGMPGLYLIVHGLLGGDGGDDDPLHAAKPSDH